MIHDCQVDYYGRKLATCSSDHTIKIFDISGDSVSQNVAIITGHEGPVWQVAWGHPKFGIILASCSYDSKVLIHKETSPGNWEKIFTHDKHESSVNSICWGPYEYGFILACASSDGKISIIENKDDEWFVEIVICNAIFF